jgi:predicted nucleic acid-binding protein
VSHFLDTNFLIDLGRELEGRRVGAARTFLGNHRNRVPSISVISLGELATGMEDNEAARRFVERFRIVALKPEIALAAAEIDRHLMEMGLRLGENDNWLAGFARYYGGAARQQRSGF